MSDQSRKGGNILNSITPQANGTAAVNNLPLWSRSRQLFAIFTVLASFVLLLVGGLVGSEKAGLTIPDWPASMGHLLTIPVLSDGARIQYLHRVLAAIVALMTVVLAIWTWRVDQRRWMRGLTLAALGAVFAQAIVGGITVLKLLPPLLATAHTMLGQTFFSIVVCIAVFGKYAADKEEPSARPSAGSPMPLVLLIASVIVLYSQLFLGSMFRHDGMGWGAHVGLAGLVFFVLTWTGLSVLSRYFRSAAVRRTTLFMMSLLIVQLSLGFIAFLENVVNPALLPKTSQIVASTAHGAVGALLLATSIVLTIQVWRHVSESQRNQISSGAERVATA